MAYNRARTATPRHARVGGDFHLGGRMRQILAIAFLAGTSLFGVNMSAARAHDVPAELVLPSGNVAVLEVFAEGVQIYACQANPNNASLFEWTFRAPEAILMNEDGETVGTHYAGPSWEGNDGSKVVGEARANAPSPDPNAIPWLLLQARSNEGAGLLSSITYVQRIDTAGGRTPATGCDRTNSGRDLRVPYTATYVFAYPAAK